MTTQSGFFDRLRRPRLSASGRDDINSSRPGSGLGYGTAASTEDVTMHRPQSNLPGASRLSGVTRATSGLPRSSSSSHVHQLPPIDQGRERTSGNGTPRNGVRAHSSSHSQGNIRFPGTPDGNPSEPGTPSAEQRSNQTSVLGGGVGGIGRMLRRYSHGPGKNLANATEARAAATASPSTQSPMTPAPVRGSGQGNGEDRAVSRIPASSTLADMTAVERGANSTPDRESRTRVADSSLAPPTNEREADSRQRSAGQSETQQPPVHRIRLVPNLEATRSLHFEPIERDIVEGAGPVKIGRFTDRGQQANAESAGRAEVAGGTSSHVADITISEGANPSALHGVSGVIAPRRQGMPGARGGAIPNSTGGTSRVDTGRIAFKSKVVSRGHAEIWCEAGGKFFIRDTKSSSGTFLNHIRLSSPNLESRPSQLRDGDVVQLGVDYQGGLEEIYRCVKMRIELNRDWQRGANEYNINALRQLEVLRGNSMQQATTPGEAGGSALPTNREALSVTDCCICLYSVSVCQALFIAPCSHVYHYKCIRPLINRHFPGFQCPLCRTFADLEAEVERDDAWQEDLLRAEIASREDASRAALNAITPRDELTTLSLGSAIDQASQVNSGGPDRSNGEQMASTGRHAHDGASAGQTENIADETLAQDTQAAQGSRPDASDANVLPSRQVAEATSAINIRSQENSLSQSQRAMFEAFGMSGGLGDARTPQNEHFLSTLAEAPPPPTNSLRAMAIEARQENGGSLGDVFSTPLQGNSPREPSSLDAAMSARSETQLARQEQVPLQDGTNDGPATPLFDTKGKAPQTQQALSAPHPELGRNGVAQSSKSSPDRAEHALTTVAAKDNANLGAVHAITNGEQRQARDKRDSIVSDRSGSGESSRDTHRTGNSSGSGSAVPTTAPLGEAPASPGSSGKVARFFKRAPNVAPH